MRKMGSGLCNTEAVQALNPERSVGLHMAALQGVLHSPALPRLQSDNSPFLGTEDPSTTAAETGCLFTDLKQHRQQLATSKILLIRWLGASTLKAGCPHHLARQPAFLFASPPDISAKPAYPLGAARHLSQRRAR